MPETLTEYQQFLANHLGIDSVTRTDLFRHELEGYGVDSIENFEDAYYGCYPDVQTFVEDFVNECYSDVVDNLPTWLQYAIDYEMFGTRVCDMISLKLSLTVKFTSSIVTSK